MTRKRVKLFSILYLFSIPLWGYIGYFLAEKSLSKTVLSMNHSPYNSLSHEDKMNQLGWEPHGSERKVEEAMSKLYPKTGTANLSRNKPSVLSGLLNHEDRESSQTTATVTQAVKMNNSNKPNTDLLSTVENSSRHRGLAIMQFLNFGYINITKSWICNVECMDVLQFTVFVTSDEHAYWALKHWKPHLNVVLRKFGDSKSMKFKEDSYNEFMCYRVRLVDTILKLGVTIFLVESDAVWFANPIDFVERYSNADIVATANKADKENHRAMAGFVFLNATSATRHMWTKFRRLLEQISEAYHNGTGQTSGDMGILNNLIRSEGLKIEWLPKDRFFSGQWYGKPRVRDTGKKPVVIQNNFIKGNDRKEARSKQWNHWFLSNSTEECIGNPCR